MTGIKIIDVKVRKKTMENLNKIGGKMGNKIEINGETYTKEDSIKKSVEDKDENENENCNNSTYCDNSAYCLYCNKLVLEKYSIFNKPLNKKQYKELKNKIQSQLGYWKRPEQLTDENKNWLKENIKEFDLKVLNKIIEISIIPDKPKILD